MTDFLLTRLGIDDIKTLRRVSVAIACGLAIFDVYTDVNTVYTLYTSNKKELCSYNCPAVLASTLVAFIIYSMVTQARYVYQRYEGNCCYAFLSLLGYAPIVIAMDIWDDIDDDDLYRRFFRIRWMETTNEALPAAAIQIVVLFFFSTSISDAQEVTSSSLVDSNELNATILIFISIILSLWSVGNGTRKYCAFVGKFNKPIWYYYSLALYTATDMFNRSLVLSLFFVVILKIQTFDEYIIVVIAAVVIHQIVFHYINLQRNVKTGVDDGKIGKKIKSNPIYLAIFITFYMWLPSSVIFLRNFHVKKARIAFWITWINGVGIILGGIAFFTLRVTLDNKQNDVLYTIGAVYIMAFNTIPFVLVLYGRLKTRYKPGEEPNFGKQLTATGEQLEMSPQQERELEIKRKIEKQKKVDEKLREEKKEKIRKKQEEKAKRLQQLEEEQKLEREEKKKKREERERRAREKQKEEDQKRRQQFEERQREKQRRMESKKSDIAETPTADNGAGNASPYDPRNDDDMESVVSDVSTFSAYVVSMDKQEKKKRNKAGKHRQTQSDNFGVGVIKEEEEQETSPKSDDATAKQQETSPKSEESKKPKLSDRFSLKRKKKKARANSDQLNFVVNDNVGKKQEELQEVKETEDESDKNKKPKLDNKSSVNKKKKKKGKSKRANSDQLASAAKKYRKDGGDLAAVKEVDEMNRTKSDEKPKTGDKPKKRRKKKSSSKRSASMTPMTEAEKAQKLKKMQKNKSSRKNKTST